MRKFLNLIINFLSLVAAKVAAAQLPPASQDGMEELIQEEKKFGWRGAELPSEAAEKAAKEAVPWWRVGLGLAALALVIGGGIAVYHGKRLWGGVATVVGAGLGVWLLGPQGLEFNLFPTSGIFLVLVTLWGVAKLIQRTTLDDKALMVWVTLGLLSVTFLERFIGPAGFVSPAWWWLAAIWMVVWVEKHVLDNPGLPAQAAVRWPIAILGWYVLGVLA